MNGGDKTAVSAQTSEALSAFLAFFAARFSFTDFCGCFLSLLFCLLCDFAIGCLLQGYHTCSFAQSQTIRCHRSRGKDTCLMGTYSNPRLVAYVLP